MKKQQIKILFLIGVLVFPAGNIYAENADLTKEIALKSLRSINRKNGINSQESVLIAQHCLNKSPYKNQYLMDSEEIKVQDDEEQYIVSFPPKAEEEECSFKAYVDKTGNESTCFCESQEKEFVLKSGYLTTADEHKIHFDHYQKGQDKVIVLVHGFYNSKEAVLFIKMAQDLNEEYDVISMDMRGHGLSTGLFTWTAKSPNDLERVLTYASERYDQIGLVGFSLGAATSIIATAKMDCVDSLIAVSAPTEFAKIDGKFWTLGFEENIKYTLFEEGRIGKGIRPGLLWFKKTKPIEVVNQIKVPTFFLHGKKDWLINDWHSKDLFKKANCPKELKIIEEGTHAEYLYRRDAEGTMKLIKEWFDKTLNAEDS